ncbi:MAG: hypothetical protein DRJ66_01250 [Thermoprotei archaeon]|nr:MAG: hypothetical protein DRJ66_01250 [Thermoprotei archaeon]
MMRAVIKVGGSVLKDIDSFNRVAESIVELIRKGFSVVVVVSAIKGFTDYLLDMVTRITKDISRYGEFVDEVLSMGERLSSRLLALALSKYGIKVKVLDPISDEWPIITDDRHGEAKVIFKEVKSITERCLKPILERGYCLIVPGFIGRSKGQHKITTMGRNTSDVTAAVLALALSADYLIYVKDEGGIVENLHGKKRVLDRISIRELQELVIHGAKVLHPEALKYIRRPTKVIFTSVENLAKLKGTYVTYDENDITIVKDLGLIAFIGVKNPRGLITSTFIEEGKIEDLIIKDDTLICLVKKEHMKDIEKLATPLGAFRIMHKQEGVALIRINTHEVNNMEIVLREIMDKIGITVYDLMISPGTIKIILPNRSLDQILPLLRGVVYGR